MSKSSINSHSIAIPCPDCACESTQTIGQLKSNPDLVCDDCGATFQVDPIMLRREINALQKKYNAMERRR